MPKDSNYETGTNLADYIQPPFKEVKPVGYGLDSATRKTNPHFTPKLVRTEEIFDDWEDDLSPTEPYFREVEGTLEGASKQPEVELSVMNIVREDVVKMDQLESDSKDGRVKADNRKKYTTELEALRPKVEKRVEELKKVLKILRSRDHTIHYSR